MQEPDPKPQRLERAARPLGSRYRLAPQQQRRLEMLGQKDEQGTLTEAEHAELMQLLHPIEDMSRHRARALAELL